ncbi:hypothetical protein FXF65_30225 [Actinomadura syzygii]|uniref:Uncharacterized protein n=2 Tax=Actinomadura syzygii TaxID=1427538 RepID=A0A5D0U0U4_9ACTN|nr:hypothetical protein FXF65_30225 [Actinomadura syzygii]
MDASRGGSGRKRADIDREFVESQEAVGMRVIGQFHDEDDPNRYVWLRGFRDMEARKAALTDAAGSTRRSTPTTGS